MKKDEEATFIEELNKAQSESEREVVKENYSTRLIKTFELEGIDFKNKKITSQSKKSEVKNAEHEYEGLGDEAFIRAIQGHRKKK